MIRKALAVVSVPVTLTIILVYIGFTSGAALGANAAINDSVTYGEAQENVSNIAPNVRQDIRENYTGLREDMALMIGESLITPTVSASLFGLEVGYEYPGIGKRNSNMSLILIITLLFVGFYPMIRELYIKHKRGVL